MPVVEKRRATAAWDGVHDARRAFRAALAALGTPGQPVLNPCLPRPFVAGDALLDRAIGLTLALADGHAALALLGVGPALAGAIRAAAGAPETDVRDAAFVLVDGRALPEALRAARRGSPEQPELGATLIVPLPGPPVSIPAEAPGWSAARDAKLPDPSAWLTARREAIAHPPCGVDVFAVTEAGLVALPRYVSLLEPA